MNLTERLGKLFARPYSTVPASRAQELMQQRRAVLLDVRETSEWNSGHAPNARHIPLGALPARLGELPMGRPLVAVCQSGLRSARAARRSNTATRVASGLPHRAYGHPAGGEAVQNGAQRERLVVGVCDYGENAFCVAGQFRALFGPADGRIRRSASQDFRIPMGYGKADFVNVDPHPV